MNKIAIFLAEGFEEIEAVSIIDVLRRASLHVDLVSITGKKEVRGAHNITIIADAIFEDHDFTANEALVLPGGMPGAENLKSHNGLRELIVKFNDEKKPIGAICAAPMVLGELGILYHKNATCYPGFEQYLDGAIITGNDYEVSENIVTGKGAGVAIEFALQIVGIMRGKTIAEELANKMMVRLHKEE